MKQVFLLCLLLCIFSFQAKSLDIKIISEGDASYLIMQKGSNADYSLTFNDSTFTYSAEYNAFVIPVEQEGLFTLRSGNNEIPLSFLSIRQNDTGYSVQGIPGWLTILPPLFAIFLALVFKEVIFSLFVGVWSGVFLLNGFKLSVLPASFFEVLNVYIVNALAHPDHAAVIIFSLLIGGIVSLVSANGGMLAIVNAITPLAKTRAGSQFITWIMGIVIFFDDYANTLLVGNTMRPITDKFKVSREKLAYLVDSTAAPIASVALITTWIGVELGYIAGAIEGLGLETSAYALFLNSLAYSYYAVFTLVFIFILIKTGRDFGPMLQAEKLSLNRAEPATASQSSKPEHLQEVSTHWLYAFIPILVLVVVSLGTMIHSGYDSTVWTDSDLSFFQKLSFTMGDADPYKGLLQGSLAGIAVALFFTFWVRKKIKAGTTEIIEKMTDGFKSMLPAIVILILAWSLSGVTSELHTAVYLSSFIGETVSARWLPVIVFILSALIAFSTGSSWSTMAIIFPLALPTAFVAIGGGGFENPDWDVIPAVISVILGGAVLGDHCSPISDTTVLSSLASDCNHVAHVRTQLPYALVTGFTAAVAIGPLFVIKTPVWIVFPLGILFLWGVVKVLGKK